MAHSFQPAAYSSIRVEGNDTVSQMRDDAIATYQPVNAQELFACERIAIAQVALLRCGMLDAGFHTSFMNECVRPGGMPHNMVQFELGRDVDVAKAQNRSLCLATGFDRLFRQADTFKLFIRYRESCRREYRDAVEDMDRLLALRDKLSQSPLDIPKPEAPELMDPPPPLTDDSDAASPYDPTIAIATPVPQTVIPKRGKPAPRKRIDPQPRFGTYPTGDQLPPEGVRKYNKRPVKPDP